VQWLPEIAALAGLIVLSGFFSGSETALFYLSRDELRAMQVGRPRQRMAAALLRDPDRLLTAVLFWNLIVNLSFFAVSLITGKRMIAEGQTTLAGLVAVFSLVGIIIFGEVLPKSIAVIYRKGVSELVAWPLSLSVRVLDPMMPTMASITRGLRRVLFPKLKSEPFLDADDLERALESLPAGHGIVQNEREVLHRILDLSEITIEEVMRPRGSYAVFNKPVHREALVGRLKPADYIFISDDTPGDIQEAVALFARADIPETNLERFAEPVIHVPWCAPLSEVLEELDRTKRRVVVVVNEYGATLGVASEEDLLDTILAPDPSRARRLLQRNPVLDVAPDTWHVEGLTTLRYLARKLDLSYDPDEDEAVTVNGLFQQELERFPEIGDEIEWMGYRIKAFHIDNPGQVRATVSRVR